MKSRALIKRKFNTYLDLLSQIGDQICALMEISSFSATPDYKIERSNPRKSPNHLLDIKTIFISGYL